MPFAAAASTVASLSTATVTRPAHSAMARSRAGSTHSFASRRSIAEPGAGQADDLAGRRAR